MTRSVRFSLSLRLLAALARARPAALTSAELAAAAGAHPVVVRRLLGRLARAGLTEAKSGREGGARLAVAPKRISLRAVWEAAEPASLNPCAISLAGPERLPPAAMKAGRRAEKAYLKALAATSIRDLLDSDDGAGGAGDEEGRAA